MPPRAGLQRESTAAKAMVAMIDFASFIPWGISKVASFSVHVITSIASVLISAGSISIRFLILLYDFGVGLSPIEGHSALYT